MTYYFLSSVEIIFFDRVGVQLVGALGTILTFSFSFCIFKMNPLFFFKKKKVIQPFDL